MQNQNQYVPISCWKCNAQNNAAQHSICRVCGCYLREGTLTGSKNPYSGSITDYPAFRSFIWTGVVLMVIAAGLYYVYNKFDAKPKVAASQLQPGMNGQMNTDGTMEDVTLPPDAWYNKSWWSYVSKTPSVKQILAKNNEANGKMLAPEVARTISISGKIWRAEKECFTAECWNKYEEQAWNQRQRSDLDGRMVQVPAASSYPQPGPGGRPNNNAWRDRIYYEVGDVEVAAKIPDKSMRKASVTAPGATYPSTEVIEVFNGATGSKTIKQFDEAGKVTDSKVEVMDEGKIALMKLDMESMWKKDFSANRNQAVRGIEKLADRIVFAITSTNKQGEPEVHYFDSVTGYLVKMDLKGFSVYMDDYKPYERAMVPYTMYYRRAEGDGSYSWMKFEIKAWKIGDFIDDAVFQSPGV